MGWSSGSHLATELIEATKDIFEEEDQRKEFYERMIELFQDRDCDTLDECVGIDPVFDQLWEELNPDDLLWDEE